MTNGNTPVSQSHRMRVNVTNVTTYDTCLFKNPIKSNFKYTSNLRLVQVVNSFLSCEYYGGIIITLLFLKIYLLNKNLIMRTITARWDHRNI